MPSFSFSKLIPGGNPTIILHEPALSPAALAALSSRLMQPLHIGGEQVGALYCPDTDKPSSLPRLRMMGGEFCVNATRAAALLLARQGCLAKVHCSGAPVWGGSLLVSGMEQPALILVSRDEEALSRAAGEATSPIASCGQYRKGECAIHHNTRQGKTGEALFRTGCAGRASSGRQEGGSALSRAEGDGCEPGLAPGEATSPIASTRTGCAGRASSIQDTLLHCAARVDCSAPETVCRPLRPGITLVHMPGMTHALIDAGEQSLPDFEGNGWKRASADRRSECGLDGAPASGVIWFRREGSAFRIWPAVEVKATLSEHLESACGSASLALALWQWQHREAGPLDVLQPSGETLRVFPAAEPGLAWISGAVLLAAEGVAHV